MWDKNITMKDMYFTKKENADRIYYKGTADSYVIFYKKTQEVDIHMPWEFNMLLFQAIYNECKKLGFLEWLDE